MLTEKEFLSEVEHQLEVIFRASHEKYKVSDAMRNRLEGFIQAGFYMEITTKPRVEALMEAIHYEVFGKSIEARKAEDKNGWAQSNVDYGEFDRPAYLRR